MEVTRKLEALWGEKCVQGSGYQIVLVRCHALYIHQCPIWKEPSILVIKNKGLCDGNVNVQAVHDVGEQGDADY